MNNIQVTDLDFDDIKTNLKTFLQSQSTFTDYDFEGAGLSVLLDILAYNTHYNAYMANMLANEMFLDSAVKRSSAVSIAKHLGYTPRSDRAATAIIDITVNNITSAPSFLTLDSYTSFISNMNGATYSFVNITPVTIQPSNGTYIFRSVELKEGTPYTFNYTSVDPGPAEKFEIPNLNVDTTSIIVTVQPSASSNTAETYTLATDIGDMSNTSLKYFLEENTSGYYTISFGDGIIGKKLTAGNIVNIRYLITTGSLANAGNKFNQSFSMSGTIEGHSDVTIAVMQNASNGSSKETIDEIRFNAPRAFAAQQRSVTANDYISIIKSNVPNIESLSVWGGEENIPPVYGKVFISIKPTSGYNLTNVTKQWIQETVLAPRKIAGIVTEFIDPIYLYVGLRATVVYNPENTTISATNIQTSIHNIINKYFDIELEKFDKEFVLSKLLHLIDSANVGIISTLLALSIQSRVNLNLNTLITETIYFNNKIVPSSIETTQFYYSLNGVPVAVRIQDTPNSYETTGVLSIYKVTTNEILISNAGTIDYVTGTMQLSNFKIQGYLIDQPDLRITAALHSSAYNINVARNYILTIDDSTLNLRTSSNAGVVVDIISKVS